MKLLLYLALAVPLWAQDAPLPDPGAAPAIHNYLERPKSIQNATDAQNSAAKARKVNEDTVRANEAMDAASKTPEAKAYWRKVETDEKRWRAEIKDKARRKHVELSADKRMKRRK